MKKVPAASGPTVPSIGPGELNDLAENPDRTWNQKLLNYSTQKLIKESYGALLGKF